MEMTRRVYIDNPARLLRKKKRTKKTENPDFSKPKEDRAEEEIAFIPQEKENEKPAFLPEKKNVKTPICLCFGKRKQKAMHDGRFRK